MIKTGGTAAINERSAFCSNNPGIVIQRGYFTLSERLFTVYGTGHPSAISSIAGKNGYPGSVSDSTGSNAAIYGENNGDAPGVLGVFTGSSTGTGAGVALDDALAPVAWRKPVVADARKLAWAFVAASSPLGIMAYGSPTEEAAHISGVGGTGWHWWLGWTL